MILSRGIVATGFGMALLVGLGTAPTLAQNNAAAKKSAKADPQPATKATGMRRLPSHFGQVGLSPDQRESVYTAIAKHQEKITALEEQLAEARTTMMKDCERVLTDPQRQLLEQRRSATKESQEEARPAPATKKAGTRSTPK